MKNALLLLFVLISSMAYAQLNMTTENVYGKEFEYDFKDYLKIDLTFISATELYWVEGITGTDAKEKINTIHINDHTTLIGWAEKDKTVFSLYSDFSTGEVHGYQYKRNGRVKKLTGTISLKTNTSLPEANNEDLVSLKTTKVDSDLITKTLAETIKIVGDSKVINSPTANEGIVFGLYPEASTRLLALSDIESLDAQELKIMRNEIFARYGHDFIDGGKMDMYFKNQSWYVSKNVDVTPLLSEIEKQNITLIKSRE